MTKPKNASWGVPEQEPDVSGGENGRDQYQLEKWRTLTARVRDLAEENDWSKSEVARRSDIPNGTFSQWYSGKYAGRLDKTNAKLGMWLEAAAEASAIRSLGAIKPSFIKTRTATEVISTLQFAHACSKLAAITLEAGMGKTECCNQYCKTQPHAYRIVMRPNVKKVHGMLVELIGALKLAQHNPSKLDRTIGEWIAAKQVPVLLIIDEAQNLEDEAIDQLRYFSDEFDCGVVLVGNSEIYDRIRPTKGKSYAQARSRFAKTLKRKRPYPEDIKTLINAWGVEDPEAIKRLTGMGQKPGALRNITETMELASMVAAGDGVKVGLPHIDAAWKNRATEELA